MQSDLLWKNSGTQATNDLVMASPRNSRHTVEHLLIPSQERDKGSIFLLENNKSRLRFPNPTKTSMHIEILQSPELKVAST